MSTNTVNTRLLLTIAYADLPPDVLAVGKPIDLGLEVVLTNKALVEGPDDAGNARFWRDKALAAVGRHLVGMLVVAEEVGGEGHEVEPFVISEEVAYVASAIEELGRCLAVVGQVAA